MHAPWVGGRLRRGLSILGLTVLITGTAVTATSFPAAAAPTSFIGVAAGRSHSCAIAESAPGSGKGRVWCWGANGSGQLGTRTVDDFSDVPLPVSLLDDAVQIAAGGRHTCAVRSDATVWCWGADNTGQLGDGSTSDSVTPVRVTGLGDVAEVTAGRAHSCARTHGGQVWCWGSAAFGALGDSSVVDAPLDLHTINTDNEEDLAISQDGTRLYVATAAHPGVDIIATDGHYVGALPTGFGPSPLLVPVSVAPAPDGSVFVVQNMSVAHLTDHGEQVQPAFTLPCSAGPPCAVQGAAVDSSGTLFVAWTDYQGHGTLAAFPLVGLGAVDTSPLWSRETALDSPGDLTTYTDARGVTRLFVRFGDTITSYSASGFVLDTFTGSGDSCDGRIEPGRGEVTVDPEGDLLVTSPGPGRNCVSRFSTDGVFLGSFGTTGAAPGQLDEPLDVAADPDGNLYVLDSANNRIQRFDRTGAVDFNWGARPFTSVPIQVAVPMVDDAQGRLSAGAHHTCASLGLDPALELWCWGDNGAGQLNRVPLVGTSTSIPGPARWQWVDAVAGSDHTCARQGPTGAVYCWGDNGSGQLGNGAPNLVDAVNIGITDSTRLSAGGAFTCSVVTANTGGVRCWGSDSSGQLGDGPGSAGCTPATAGFVVADDPGCGLVADVSALATGVAHACAVTDGGTGVVCWGRNEAHQVSPTDEPALSHAVTVRFPDVAADVEVSVTPEPPDDVATGLSLDGRLIVTFSSDVSSVSTHSVRLTTSEGEAVPADVDCVDGGGASVDCGLGPVHEVRVTPSGLLIPGGAYVVTVNGPGATDPVSVAGTALAPFVSEAIPAVSEISETSPAVVSAWRPGRSASALGRRFVSETTPGAWVSYAFTGSRIAWVTARGPGEGRARLSVDGVPVRSVDLRSTRQRFKVKQVVRGLVDGPHVLTIRVVRRADPPRTGRVLVDGFVTRHAGITTTDSDPVLTMAWATTSSWRASEGSYAVSASPGASTRVTFVGTSLLWRTFRGSTQGDARVDVDGSAWRTVHTYGRGAAAPTGIRINGLEPGVHTVRIVVLGSGRGRQHNVAVDGFVAG